MKGISPIIASVLLIAITMSIAVVLAAYVTSYTRSATAAIPSACIGGALFVDGTPKCAVSGTGSKITITVEGSYVALNTFTLDSRKALPDGSIVDTAIAQTGGPTSLAAGDIGTLTFDNIPNVCSAYDDVRVSTNCFNVRTDWTAKA